MRLDEFKAWFDGYTEDLESPPTKKQWARIKEQVGKIDGVHITYPVYRYPGYWQPGILVGATGGVVQLNSSNNATSNAVQFDSRSAMYASGKAEAAA